MKELRLKDCLVRDARRVTEFERYHDLRDELDGDVNVFAVFSDAGDFIGLVTCRQAMLFPGRIFADLIVTRQPVPLAAEEVPAQGLQRLRHEGLDYLPVIGQGGAFFGVTSVASILAALMRRDEVHRVESQLLMHQLRGELVNRRVAANIFDATSDAVMVMDENWRIVLVNRAFSDITGVSAALPIGRRPRFVCADRHKAGFFRAILSAIRETGNWEGEIWLARPNGANCPGWVSIRSVSDETKREHRYVAMFSDANRHDGLRAQFLNLAYYDSLTGLPNRQFFMDRLQQAIAASRRTGRGFSVLFLDLDRFKDINDTLGHSFGDRLLATVSERFRALVRDVDTVARLGGDEFTFILHEMANPTEVAALARRILSAISVPVMQDGMRMYVSGSIGVSRYPADGATADALLMNADAAMYRAKETGNGAHEFYSPALHDRLSARLDISNALHHALEQNELSLVWQPQVSLAGRRIVGAEVLLRWNRGGKEMVPPGVFIPIAEETGMIGQIGEWVLHEACRQAVRLEPVLGADSDFRVAINFSPLQLRWHKEKSVAAVIREYGLPTHRFKIELTENSLFLQQDEMLAFVGEVHAAGIAISIDDFGTGYCNLSRLRSLPVHEIKIDRSFVKDMPQSPGDSQIVRAMLMMARTLGLRVVAEGIEDTEQLALLDEMGCDVGQGYLFSRPVAMEVLQGMILAEGVAVGGARSAA